MEPEESDPRGCQEFCHLSQGTMDEMITPDEANRLLEKSKRVKWLPRFAVAFILYALISAFYLALLRIEIDNLKQRLIALEYCDMQYNAAEIIKIQETYDWNEGIFKRMLGIPAKKRPGVK